MTFGQSYTANDYARGAPTGRVTTGGLYAFNVGTNDWAFRLAGKFGRS